MRYEYVRQLALPQPDPALLARYLLDVVSNEESFTSAVTSMVRIPVGFNALYISNRPRIQLNFYRDDITGNEDPHGHARYARTGFYAPPNAVQTVVRHKPLSAGTRRLPGLPMQELQITPNNILESGKGGRPTYGLVALGPTLLIKNSETRKATLSSEDFLPWEVHDVRVHGLKGRVAISTHLKGREEPANFSEREGLIGYKHMSPDYADSLIALRNRLKAQIAAGELANITRLGPATMIYTPFDRDILTMDPTPVITSPALAEELILGGLQTARELAKIV